MATPVVVPSLGESVTQATLLRWLKAEGAAVAKDESLCELETDKANVEIPSPVAGVLRRVRGEQDTVAVAEVIARIDDGAAGGSSGAGSGAGATSGAAGAGAGASAAGSAAARPATLDAGSVSDAVSSKGPSATVEDLSPAVRRLVMENKLDPATIKGTGPGGRITVEDVQGALGGNGNSAQPPTAAPRTAAAPQANPASGAPAPVTAPAQPVAPATASTAAPSPLKPPQGQGASEKLHTDPNAPPADFDARGERRVKMTRIRAAIARRLVAAQQTAAILTTFNEVDLTEVMALRARFKERFQEVHGVGLGFMSFFARAAVASLREFPRVNAYLEDDEIVYHKHVNLGIAVSTERGLAVPVLRNVQDLSFGAIESQIKRLAIAVRDGKIGIDELSGGTFTITNGGVFGSLLSTPILNPPQAAILGMHAIQKRAVVINDKIEIRPMMYLALSYDHRLVDGRESISFLVRVKQLLEDPARLMLDI